MRVDELLGVKKFANMSGEAIVAKLKEMGGKDWSDVEVLGSGGRGSAVRIGKNVYKMWMVDKGYTEFVNYALKHQDDPFMPKFKGGIKRMPAFFLRSPDAPDHVNYIQVERLERLHRTWGFKNGKGPAIKPYHLATGLRHFKSRDKALKAVKAGPDADPQVGRFLDTFEGLLAHITGDNWADTFEDNFMKRADGQVVIIDPIANGPVEWRVNEKLQQFARDLADGKAPESKKTARSTK